MENILQMIINSCNNNGINIIYGTLKNYDDGNRIELDEDVNYDEIFSIINKIGCKILVIDKDYFQLENFRIEEDKIDLFQTFAKYNGELFEIKIYFTCDGTVYEKVWNSDFYWDFYKELVNQKELISQIEENKRIENQKKIQEIAEEIARQEWYFRVSTRNNESNAAINDYLRKNNLESMDLSTFMLKAYVDRILVNNYLNIHSKNLNYQINQLIKAGKTKISIINELGITPGMFDKYK